MVEILCTSRDIYTGRDVIVERHYTDNVIYW